ncbi:hypothetical protein FRC03_005863 [Tulasnella sp. 419]|nr:hypothetical protein FRC03_005863 [Tulasnella sp. 419]
MSMEPKLTKKQRKGLAHRERGRQRVKEQPADVPEIDLPADEDPGLDLSSSHQNGPIVSSESKKRKRDDSNVPQSGNEDPELGPRKKAKATPRTSDHKGRFIVFVGNLSYKTSIEAIQSHFSQPSDPSQPPPQPPLVRLLTKKVPQGATPKSRTKGCAFVEFRTGPELQRALKLHHTELEGRIINVELTAGGGGSGEKRREKVVERNKRLEAQRNKKLSSNSGPPPHYGDQGHGKIRHSTTSGTSSNGPDSKKTWANAEEKGNDPKRRIRGFKKKADVDGSRWASGANAVQATRVWGAGTSS